MNPRVEEIRRRLAEAFEPTVLDIQDDSQSHAGHAGAAESGGGHFYATIVASAFEGKTLVRRHQSVYEALGEMMRADIHALSIKAFTPAEYQLSTHQE
ncbi:MAG: BolA family transcriptional regulator [Methylococcaceae bacterium]|nr:BolA family transcriptional regulator [Methylococcaceae bacterium]